MVNVDILLFSDIWNIPGNKASDFLGCFVSKAFHAKYSIRVFTKRDCRFYSCAFKIFQILRNNQFGLIYIATPDMPIGILAKLLCRLLKLPFKTPYSVDKTGYFLELYQGIREQDQREAVSKLLLDLIVDRS